MKFSKKFESTWRFYLHMSEDGVGNFLPPILDEKAPAAKEVFFLLENGSRDLRTSEPELLRSALIGKAFTNLQIKMWAECICEWTSTRSEIHTYIDEIQWPRRVHIALEGAIRKERERLMELRRKDKTYFDTHLCVAYDNWQICFS